MTDKSMISPERAIAFLKECAGYFDMEPTRNEDSQHWANVTNAETCRRIAKLIASPSPAPSAGVDAVAVKPLEWHKSYMPSWNGDYHTVPTAYSVRCADENGWKWQGLGAHGYERSSETAQRAAQQHHEARIRSALTPAPTPVEAGGETVGWIDETDVAALARIKGQTGACRITAIKAHGGPGYVPVYLAKPASEPAGGVRDWRARYEWLRDWYFREGKRAEIHEHGHIIRTTPETFDAGVDAGIARAALSAPASSSPAEEGER